MATGLEVTTCQNILRLQDGKQSITVDSFPFLIQFEHYIVVVVALPRIPFQQVQTGNIPESLTICGRVGTVPLNEEIQAVARLLNQRESRIASMRFNMASRSPMLGCPTCTGDGNAGVAPGIASPPSSRFRGTHPISPC